MKFARLLLALTLLLPAAADAAVVSCKTAGTTCVTASGNVNGPASSTSGNLASFSNTSGTGLQDTGIASSAVALLTATQTLTNKTLTAPAISTPAITGVTTATNNANPCFQVGPNGATNPVFRIDCSTASQENGVMIIGSASGGGEATAYNPIIRPEGNSASGLSFRTKNTFTTSAFQFGGSSQLELGMFSSAANDPPRLRFMRTKSNTVGTFSSNVASGDDLGALDFTGTISSSRQSGARIQALVDATPGSSDMPTRMEILTSRDGSATPTLAMRIDSKQHVTYSGSASPSVASGALDCGTTPAIAGNDNLGRVTVGSSTNGGVCTLTFQTAWAHAPICQVFNETTANMLRPVVTTTTLAITGTLLAGDSVSYRCADYF